MHGPFKMEEMSDKSNLYIFDRKEVFLIFIFMVLIGITSFILGVKVGKQYSYERSGFIPADRERVKLASEQEEVINKVKEA